MSVFVTGATGFIGSRVVKDLIARGHRVIGLTRSDEGAEALKAAGAEPLHGTIRDIGSVVAGVAGADGVIHLAFNHDFSTFAQNAEDDRALIAALASELKGSDRPLLITSGVAIARGEPGRPTVESDPPISSAEFPRAATEEAARAAIADGVNVSIVRLPQVHDPRRQGLIPYLIEAALAKGVFAYVGDGSNRWAAGAVDDVVTLYRLVLEKAEPGAIYHAVGEEGVAVRDMAETIGRRLNLPTRSITPEEAPEFFGWLAHLAGNDIVSSSAQTRARLGWAPKGPTLLEDLERLEGYEPMPVEA